MWGINQSLARVILLLGGGIIIVATMMILVIAPSTGHDCVNSTVEAGRGAARQVSGIAPAVPNRDIFSSDCMTVKLSAAAGATTPLRPTIPHAFSSASSWS